jgi:hypothetical protein
VDHGVDEVGERLRTGLGAGELDRGRRAELRRVVLAVRAREVEVHGVRRHGEQAGAGGGLVPGEVGSRHAGDPATPVRVGATRLE